MIALVGAMFVAMGSVSAAPSLVVDTTDSDNTVGAGGSVDVTLQLKGAASGSYDIDFVVAGAGVVIERDSDVTMVAGGDPAPAAVTVATLIVPKAASGKYTVSAGVTVGTSRLENDVIVTVGDVGTAVSSAEVVLGKVGHGDTDGNGSINDDDDAKPANDSASTPAGGATANALIAVTVNVKNSLGNAPNSDEVDAIHLFAPLGSVYAPDITATAVSLGEVGSGTNDFAETGTGESRTDNVKASAHFFVGKGTAGTIDVHAIVIGTKGSTTSSTLTLTFTGTADVLEVGSASSPIKTDGTAKGDLTDVDTTADVDESMTEDGVATVDVTATDASGNKAALKLATQGDGALTTPIGITTDNDDTDVETRVSASVVNAEGEDAKIRAQIAQGKKADGSADNNKITIKVVADSAEPGDYTLRVVLGDDDPVTTTIVVADKVDSVSVESSEDTVSVGDIFTVTATVTDEGGNLLPDDADSVGFAAYGDLKLTPLADDANSRDLNDGTASIMYLVIQGSGTASIVATYGGKTGVASVATAAVEEAMPDEEASVACLSNLAGFSTWSCSVETSASEIFGLVSGRGATALHLWNGSAWVRYSVVDGTMVPGSSDFMVAENDILYISN